MKSIKFEFNVNGAIATLSVYANKEYIEYTKENGECKGEFDKQFPDAEEVKIKFVLVGAVGTGYTVGYVCKKNDNLYVDPQNPTPIKRKIVENNTAIEIVRV